MLHTDRKNRRDCVGTFVGCLDRLIGSLDVPTMKLTIAVSLKDSLSTIFRRPATPISTKTRKSLFNYKKDVYWYQQYETLYIHLHAKRGTET